MSQNVTDLIGKKGLYILTSFFFCFWLLLQSSPDFLTRSNLGKDQLVAIFGASYGLVALWGGLYAIKIAKRWGGMKSLLGKSIVVFGIGLLAQEFGQIMYTFYIYYLGIENPYPSIGDIGYLGSTIFYCYGIYLLSQLCGVKISLHTLKSKLQSIILPLLLLLFSYWIFLADYELNWSNPVLVILDFVYPMSQALNIGFAFIVFLLSRGTLGGIMKNKIRLIILALLIQYFADFIFLFQSHYGLWSTGGISELTYLLSYFFMSLALLNFHHIPFRVLADE